MLAAADGYSYLHLVIVAGIITFAAGVRVGIRALGGSPSGSVRLALCGGLAAYLVGHIAFSWRVTGSPEYRKGIIVVGLLVLYAVGGGLPAWALAALITGLLVVLCGVEGLWSPHASISSLEPAAVHRDAAPPPI